MLGCKLWAMAMISYRRLMIASALWSSVQIVSLVRAETLTVATYNIENYGPANRMTASGYRKEYPKPEAEKQALRAVIRGLNADVLVLQEMGPQAYLDELQRDLKTEGLDYPAAVLAGAADADRHVAILSRRPLRNIATHTDLEFTYLDGKEKVKRGLLEVVVGSTDGEFTIFAVHLKSRFTERPDDPLSTIRRTGEATAIRDRVLKRFPAPADSRFVIVGDCNDAKSSKPIERLHARGKTVIAELLPVADSRGETWTHAYRREDSYTRVDHILVSPGLMPMVVGRKAKIFDGDGVRTASDHRPVIVSFSFGEKK
jgi:endonuclease/exonuclease/phosphatase family metal-dependent hydrolase